MKLREGDEVIALDLARNDADLLVVTDAGFGKRTRLAEYRPTGRSVFGVSTIRFVKERGRLAGALVVREGYQVVLISTGGTVIRMPVDGIRQAGRLTQGVRVMTLREGESVSALARVVEQANDDGAEEGEEGPAVDGLATADGKPAE